LLSQLSIKYSHNIKHYQRLLWSELMTLKLKLKTVYLFFHVNKRALVQRDSNTQKISVFLAI